MPSSDETLNLDSRINDSNILVYSHSNSILTFPHTKYQDVNLVKRKNSCLVSKWQLSLRLLISGATAAIISGRSSNTLRSGNIHSTMINSSSFPSPLKVVWSWITNKFETTAISTWGLHEQKWKLNSKAKLFIANYLLSTSTKEQRNKWNC